MKSISEHYTKLKNMDQLNNVIDVQTISELDKEISSLNIYHDNLVLKKN